MLSAEADRRLPAIRDELDRLSRSGDPDPAAVERIRTEAHGLRGAAMVIGESRLAELADGIESAVAGRLGPGTIAPALAARLSAALDAFGEGAAAAAAERPEPASVQASLDALG